MNPVEILKLWEGGLASYGGAIGEEPQPGAVFFSASSSQRSSQPGF